MCLWRSRLPIAWTTGALALVACADALGDTITASWQQPSLDRWMYPFNATPGTRTVVSTFGSTPGGTDFDSRDGQYILAWQSSSQIPPGLGASAYDIESVRVTIEYANDLVVAYDPTPDPWQSFLATSDAEYIPDPDSGQPIEIFGCGFRNGFTSSTFLENSPYATPPNPMASGVRNAYAMSFDSAGTAIDVSNSPRQRFDPLRFAVGLTSLQAGSPVPINTPMTFDLDVGSPAVGNYLRNSLNEGRLFLVVTSLTFVEQQGGNFPAFYAKENPLVQFQLAHAARLEIVVTTQTCSFADINCDGTVDGLDLTAILSNWGAPGQGDVNDDGTTDGLDLTAVLSGWSS